MKEPYYVNENIRRVNCIHIKYVSFVCLLVTIVYRTTVSQS